MQSKRDAAHSAVSAAVRRLLLFAAFHSLHASGVDATAPTASVKARPMSGRALPKVGTNITLRYSNAAVKLSDAKKIQPIITTKSVYICPTKAGDLASFSP